MKEYSPEIIHFDNINPLTTNRSKTKLDLLHRVANRVTYIENKHIHIVTLTYTLRTNRYWDAIHCVGHHTHLSHPQTTHNSIVPSSRVSRRHRLRRGCFRCYMAIIVQTTPSHFQLTSFLFFYSVLPNCGVRCFRLECAFICV